VTPVRRALISVRDKTGAAGFAQFLAARGAQIISTGGTARSIKESGVGVTEVSACTGFPEIMDGRVKTLHPLIHGAILARRGVDDEAAAAHGIRAIDLVAVNLYPFAETVAGGGDFSAAVDNIDIGGPALLRAAAKNHDAVTVIADPADYATVQAEIAKHGGVTPATRRALAAKAFAHTARYDRCIADYFAAAGGEGEGEHFPAALTLRLRKKTDLRYGENPHQRAALYRVDGGGDAGEAAVQLQGKPLSFNNIVDADCAMRCAAELGGEGGRTAVVIVKHATPCGAAVAGNLVAAYTAAHATDPDSAFGGVLACSAALDKAAAEAVLARQFVEVLAAPAVDEDAIPVLAGKGNVRVVTTSAAATTARRLSTVTGGVLVQDADNAAALQAAGLKVVTTIRPDAATVADLLFAWTVAAHVKSNAIVYARDGRTVGIGAGQMSRVDSVHLAGRKAGPGASGAVMASDAFFPFRDAVDAAAAHGIRAIIQPGGSLRDPEVIAAANAHGMAMAFTGRRRFRH